MTDRAENLAIVIIGRNEGERLVRGLASAEGAAARIVYVDSGSTDGSVAAARAAGAEVVELDRSAPFTAARARNAGFARLRETGRMPPFVQFIDGDCALVPGWLAKGIAALENDPGLGLVTGWRSEISRDASVYNAIADVEWHRPAGSIRVCGGDMMVRSAAFEAVGGFDPGLIASEDEEFCLRLGKAGWRLVRLAEEMTRHDLAMSRFSEWWRRAVRAGHGFAQVGSMHPEHFVPERRRVWFYAVLLPVLFGVGLIASVALALLVIVLYLISYLRTAHGLHRNGQPWGEAFHHALLISISKFANLAGMMTYRWRMLRRKRMELIEYK